METKKFKEARKPLGIYLEHIDGPTDNFGESDSSWYEPNLFTAEIEDCNDGSYKPRCPLGIKRTRVRIGVERYNLLNCPGDCSGKTVGYKIAIEEYTLEERIRSVQTYLGRKSRLDSKEREDLKENLKTLKEYKKICPDEYDCLTPQLKERYETDWVDLVKHLRSAALTGISTKYPRIARDLKKYFDAIRSKNL